MPYTHFHNWSFHTHHQRPKGGPHDRAVRRRQRPWKIGFFVALVVSLLWFGYVSGWYNRFLDTGAARESNDGSSVLETARTPPREESAGSFAAAPSAPVGHMPPTLKLTPAMQQAPPPVSRSTIFPQPTLPAGGQLPVPHTPVATGMAVPSQLMVTPIASPRRTATPSPTPSSTITPTPNPILPPHRRHLAEKEYTLTLINAERKKAGVRPLVLGTNNAAQLHAESALANCFSSHWGMDGLKPYHRYSLAGGYQSNGENGHGLDYCYKASDWIAPVASIRKEIEEAIAGWTRSPGHRRNLLDPLHHKVNIGIAWDRFNEVQFHHFEGEYVTYSSPPSLENGILTLNGQGKNGVQFSKARDLSVQIYFDPPARPLNVGQLARTYCYTTGVVVASLREPLTGNRFWPTHPGTTTYTPCPDPYEVSPDASPPRSASEAQTLWARAANTIFMPKTITFQWITAESWEVSDSSFSLRADLGKLLDEHGDGIYTLLVWGPLKGRSQTEVISEVVFFWRNPGPNTYAPSNWPDDSAR